MITCQITNKEFKSLNSLSIHITRNLKDVITKKEYYDKFLIKENEGSCYFCENEANFLGFKNGYNRICTSKECVGKTRATGTYEFLMYKYGYDKETAILEQEKRAADRGKKIKKSFDKELETNPMFNHERCVSTKEYWIKRGFSEEDAIIEAKKNMKNFIGASVRARKKNPENYMNNYPNQVGYWLKKGHTEEEAIAAVKERQAVGRLDRFIERHGEELGKQKWKERQAKWRKSLVEGGNITCGYSNVSQVIFKLIEEKIPDNNFYYATKNKEYYINLKGGEFNQYDFCDRDNNKIIEFNGDVFHGNPNKFNAGDRPNPHRQNLTAQNIWDKDERKKQIAEDKGFEYLVIWEYDYRTDPDKVIEECIEFLKNI